MATPFVLTRRSPLLWDAPEPLPEHRYDPEQQINVTPDGRALMDQVAMFGESITVNSDGSKKDDY